MARLYLEVDGVYSQVARMTEEELMDHIGKAANLLVLLHTFLSAKRSESLLVQEEEQEAVKCDYRIVDRVARALAALGAAEVQQIMDATGLTKMQVQSSLNSQVGKLFDRVGVGVYRLLEGTNGDRRKPSSKTSSGTNSGVSG